MSHHGPLAGPFSCPAKHGIPPSGCRVLERRENNGIAVALPESAGLGRQPSGAPRGFWLGLQYGDLLFGTARKFQATIAFLRHAVLH